MAHAQTATPTPATIMDNVTFRAGLGLQHDDNFLRTPSGTERSEQISTQSVGININIPVSLQRFELDVGLTNSLHDNFGNFDFLGKNYSAAWRWSFTPQLHGNLTSTRAETLNSPSDSVTSTLRNKNATTTNAFDAVYEMGGPWQILAGYTRSTSLNEQPLIGDANDRSTTYSAGVRYLMASGNSLSYNLQSEKGTSTNDYDALINEVSGVWIVSGNTTMTGRLSHINRNHFAAPQFDYDGFASGITVAWRATGKINVNAAWQRALANYQTIGSTHTVTDTLSVSPVWQITPITSLSAQYSYAVRRDQGVVSGLSSNRKDTLREASIAYTWRPRPFVSLSASAANSVRKSNLAGLDYSENLVSLLAQLSF